MGRKYKLFISLTVLLSVISLFIEQTENLPQIFRICGKVIDYLLMASVWFDTAWGIAAEKYKRRYFRDNWASFLFTLIFSGLFLFTKIGLRSASASEIAVGATMVRNVFMVLRVYSRAKKLSGIIENFTTKPAQTVMLSFVGVIFAGTLLLMMDFATLDGRGLTFLQALFEATSCVCVTGLVVVDTATHFTFWGHLILIVLIQIGGLGIMLLTFFTIYAIRRRVSLSDKLMLSYMLSEDDTANVSRAMVSIIKITFCIEGTGAVLLFAAFARYFGFSLKSLWYAIFHSISAFCNAGFALYSDSLEAFRGDSFLTLTIAFLIIFGGIGFAVISNVLGLLTAKRAEITSSRAKLTLNSKVALAGTALLLIFGTLLFYILEFDNTMKDYSVGSQYLAAFFQSVTFRTAGFNSVPLGNLRPLTYFIFSIFMVIGAASGSTAGGLKINTVAVLLTAVRSYLKGEKTHRIGNAEIAPDKVFQASILFIADIACVATGVILLLLFERFGSRDLSLEFILFEVCSALGTAGVTAGITPDLTALSKLLLIALMFWGRVGGLTILSSAPTDNSEEKIRRPIADISIG